MKVFLTFGVFLGELFIIKKISKNHEFKILNNKMGIYVLRDLGNWTQFPLILSYLQIFHLIKLYTFCQYLYHFFVVVVVFIRKPRRNSTWKLRHRLSRISLFYEHFSLFQV